MQRGENGKVRLVIPTGRLSTAVLELLEDAGVRIRVSGSDYRPSSSDERFEVKLLKAANIPKLIEFGAHDIGFSGRDWMEESSAEVELLEDTRILPVRIAAAAPEGVDPFASPNREIVVASEYENLTRRYMERRGASYKFVRTFGATEVFPPEDADMVVDNVATGRTLSANRLAIVDVLMESTTLMMANRAALADASKRETIDELRLLVRSVLDARVRVLLEMNVTADRLDGLVSLLPAMKSPTVQKLYGNDSFAVRAAVPRSDVAGLIPRLKEAGATDILQASLQRVVP